MTCTTLQTYTLPLFTLATQACVAAVWRRSGALGFYVGIVPRILRVSAEVSLQFCLFEKINNALETLIK